LHGLGGKNEDRGGKNKDTGKNKDRGGKNIIYFPLVEILSSDTVTKKMVFSGKNMI
jgi:hypothetical protein